MVRQDVEHLLGIIFSATCRNYLTEHDFLALVVHFVVVEEASTLLRSLNRPARKAARHFDYVLLCVSAVYAQRVELHQLASVILVQPPLAALALGLGFQIGPDRLEII